MTRQEYIELLKDDEGFKDRVYLDSKGIPTCGWGHALHVGSRVPMAVCELLLAEDLKRVDSDYEKLKKMFPEELSPTRRAILKCMLFQMGLAGVLKFKRFLTSVRLGDWKGAYDDMLDSQWAKTDSPARAKRLAEMFLRG